MSAERQLAADGHTPARRSGPAVHVLQADPELGAGIGTGEFERALRAAVAPVFEFDRGPWRFFPPPDQGGLGALVLAGMIIVRIDAGPRSHIEVLGEGDVLSPWVGCGSDLAIPSTVTARAASRVRIALLDRPFALATAPWPEIHGGLMHRLILRVRRVSLQSAVNALTRIEERLEVTLWQLAYRFGRVRPDGVVLQLPLTHAQLAELVAAQRPSVSTALSRLQARERLVQTARNEWLLPGEPPELSARLRRESGVVSG